MLGLNARNYQYIRPFNKRKYKKIADDKLLTKERLFADAVPTIKQFAEFQTLEEVRSFDWTSLPAGFAVKPARGYGGRGITLVRGWDGEVGVSNGQPITKADLEEVIFSTLDGEHSLNNLPDAAFIEQLVIPHSFFKKYSAKGVPDIRVVVCNKVPVMAMTRLPTIASDGKANLSMGALGVGIDMRTGITTFGVYGGKIVEYIPGTKTKVRGIKIPDWEKVLSVSVMAQQSLKLGFAGVDLVIDQDEGPLVLEVNSRPGLGIQIANQASLRTRLERIEHMNVQTVERGVELAQQLFAEEILESVETNDTILGVIEKVTIYGEQKKKSVRAKIDTGAYRTSIDSDLVEELGLEVQDESVKVRSGSGKQERGTVEVKLRIKGKDITTIASYTPRGHLRFPMIIGRRDMKGFLVNPEDIPDDVVVK